MDTFLLVPKIISGADSLEILKEINTDKVVIITDEFLLNSKMVEKVTDNLPKNCDYYIFSDIKPDPSQELIDRATEIVVHENPGAIIAFGGGSSIDACKVIRLQTIEKLHKHISFYCIPTTAGTGSEVTNFAVVTRGTSKVVLVDDKLLPEYAILDPYFTKSVPAKISADTGLDVLTHAVEALLSKGATSFSDLFAKESILKVFDHLPKVYEDGYKMSSRKEMLEASNMAGISFTNAGLGIVHSLAHTIGGNFHISHGRLNAIILPYVIKFYAARDEKVVKKLDDITYQCCKLTFLEAYKELMNTLNIEENIGQLGKINSYEYDMSIDEMAKTALNDRCTPSTPVYITKQDLVNILRDIY